MSPFWHAHHRLYNPMFFGPSRFLWFSIGSLATFAWLHHRKGEHCRPASQIGYDRVHGQWGPQGWNARFDEQQQQQQQQGTRAPDEDRSRFDGIGGRREPSPSPSVGAEASGRFTTDRELDRLREMSRNAEETVSFFDRRARVQIITWVGKQISGMSEATIDSMMGGLQRLKEVCHCLWFCHRELNAY